jgi:hypothetical protein
MATLKRLGQVLTESWSPQPGRLGPADELLVVFITPRPYAPGPVQRRAPAKDRHRADPGAVLLGSVTANREGRELSDALVGSGRPGWLGFATLAEDSEVAVRRGHVTAEGGDDVAPVQSPRRAPRRLMTPTQVAVAVWTVAVAAVVAAWGLPQGRPELFLIITFGLIAASVGNPRSWARVARDWVPLFVILTVYDTLRGYADHWSHVHFFTQIRFDTWLFGGNVPTV